MTHTIHQATIEMLEDVVAGALPRHCDDPVWNWIFGSSEDLGARMTPWLEVWMDGLIKLSGSSGLMQENPVQRCWRDVHAISSHVVMNWDVPAENFGRTEFGLPLNPAYPMF